ncbi:hypothetical protein MMPV_003236 [Pyropia vietnamensis]
MPALGRGAGGTSTGTATTRAASAVVTSPFLPSTDARSTRSLSCPPAAYVAGAAGVLATLRRVDTAVADLYAGPAVRRAVWRYEAIWLPLLAALGCDTDPPACSDSNGGHGNDRVEDGDCGGDSGGGSGGGSGNGCGCGSGGGGVPPSPGANVPFADRVAGVRVRLAASGVEESTSAARSLLAVGGFSAGFRPPLDVEWVLWAVAAGGAEPFEPPDLDVRLGRGGVLLHRRSNVVSACPPSGRGRTGSDGGARTPAVVGAVSPTTDSAAAPPPHLSPAHRLASVDLVAAAAAGRLLAWQLLRPAWAPPVGDPDAAAGGVVAPPAAAQFLLLVADTADEGELSPVTTASSGGDSDRSSRPPLLLTVSPPSLAPSAVVLLLWTGAMAAIATYATDCARLAGRILPGPLDAAHRGGALRWYSAAEPFGDVPADDGDGDGDNEAAASAVVGGDCDGGDRWGAAAVPPPPTVAGLTHWGGVSAATADRTATAWRRRFPPGSGEGPPHLDRRTGRPPKVRAGYLSACLTAAAAAAAASRKAGRMRPSAASGCGGGGDGVGRRHAGAVEAAAPPAPAPYRVCSPVGAAGDAYLVMDDSDDGKTSSTWTTDFSDSDAALSSGNSDDWGLGSPVKELPGRGDERRGCGGSGGGADRSVTSLLKSLRFSLRRGWFCPADPSGGGKLTPGCAGWRSQTSSSPRWSPSRGVGSGSGGGSGRHSRSSLHRVTFKSSSRLAPPATRGVAAATAAASGGASRRRWQRDWKHRRPDNGNRRRGADVGAWLGDDRGGDEGGMAAASPAVVPPAAAAAAAMAAAAAGWANEAKQASAGPGSPLTAVPTGSPAAAWWAAWRARSTLSFAGAVATAVAGVILLLVGGVALVALPTRTPAALQDLNDVPPGVIGATFLVAGLLLTSFGVVLLARPTLFAAARADGFASEEVRLLWHVASKVLRRRMAEGRHRLRAPWRRWGMGGGRGSVGGDVLPSLPVGHPGVGGGGDGIGGHGGGGGSSGEDVEAGDLGWSRTAGHPGGSREVGIEAGWCGREPRPPPPAALAGH